MLTDEALLESLGRELAARSAAIEAARELAECFTAAGEMTADERVITRKVMKLRTLLPPKSY